jgi:micrococcal nuclease
MMKLLLILLLTVSSASYAKTFEGVVTHVSDGDTLWIEVDSKTKPIKVRLQGIDAPEICQAWGTQARDALKERLLRQSVSLNTRAKDDYDRALGRISFRGEDVGAWLVKNGHAWSNHYRSHPGPYATEQVAARSARIGLWAQPGAKEPRQFRKQHGSCKN